MLSRQAYEWLQKMVNVYNETGDRSFTIDFYFAGEEAIKELEREYFVTEDFDDVGANIVGRIALTDLGIEELKKLNR